MIRIAAFALTLIIALAGTEALSRSNQHSKTVSGHAVRQANPPGWPFPPCYPDCVR